MCKENGAAAVEQVIADLTLREDTNKVAEVGPACCTIPSLFLRLLSVATEPGAPVAILLACITQGLRKHSACCEMDMELWSSRK